MNPNLNAALSRYKRHLRERQKRTIPLCVTPPDTTVSKKTQVLDSMGIPDILKNLAQHCNQIHSKNKRKICWNLIISEKDPYQIKESLDKIHNDVSKQTPWWRTWKPWSSTNNKRDEVNKLIQHTLNLYDQEFFNNQLHSLQPPIKLSYTMFDNVGTTKLYVPSFLRIFEQQLVKKLIVYFSTNVSYTETWWNIQNVPKIVALVTTNLFGPTSGFHSHNDTDKYTLSRNKLLGAALVALTSAEAEK